MVELFTNTDALARVAIAAGAVSTVLVILGFVDVQRSKNKFPPGALTFGTGLWVTLGGGVVALICGIAGKVTGRRR